jgi:hypothetical protein
MLRRIATCLCYHRIMAQKTAGRQGTEANGSLQPARSNGMIPKSGYRFSDKIMPR